MSVSDTGSHDRVREVFLAAIDQPHEARHALLEELCGDDPPLRRVVESLLSHHDRPIGFVRTLHPAFADDDSFLSAATDDIDPVDDDPAWTNGHCIDRYRVLSRIGTGGMGLVYRAEQESPKRIVALKVLRPGLTSDRMLRRFEHEADVLARLRHPGIARIHEAGTTDGVDGARPFFAMEFVDGSPITRYVTEHDLPVRARIELLIGVCEAVHHAHQKGVIHRDLKPSNVFVERGVEANGAGQVKILDFGVARLTDADLRSITLQTETGRLVGTVPYMSPEQTGGQHDEIDTRSDVYALGVLAFEVLGGRMPYDLDELMLHEAVRVIRDVEPMRLGSVDPAFRGDIETIAGKALEKDRDRRYSSAAALADDFRRYLAHEPIEARPASAIYQLSRFARRHRPVVGGLVAASIALVLGLGATTAAMVRAQERETDAEQVTQFLAALLQSPSVELAGPDALVVDVLREARDGIGAELLTRPVPQARLEATMGAAFLTLGDHVEALRLLDKAASGLERELGPLHRQTLHARSMLGAAMAQQPAARGSANPADYQEGHDLLARTLDEQTRMFGPDDPDTITTMGSLAYALKYMDELEDAEHLLDEAITRSTRANGPVQAETISLRQQRAAVFRAMGAYEAAEAEYDEITPLAIDKLGPAHVVTLQCRHGRGYLYRHQGRFDEAFTELISTATDCDRQLGAAHPGTLRVKSSLARTLRKDRRYTDFLDLAETIPFGSSRMQLEVAVDHVRVLRTMARDTDVEEDRAALYAAAEQVADLTLPQLERTLGELDNQTLTLLNQLALIYRDWDPNHPDAEPIHRSLLERRGRLDNRLYTISAQRGLGELYVAQQRYDDARPALFDSLDALQRDYPDDENRLSLYRLGYARCLAHLGEHQEATTVLQSLLDGPRDEEARAVLADLQAK